MDFGLDLAFDAPELAAIQEAIKPLAHHNDGIASLPALDLGGIPVAHAFVVSGTDMAAVPVGLDLDEPRAFAFADCRNHAFERPQQQLAIVAVELFARQPEDASALCKLGLRLTALDRRVRGV